MRELDLFAAIGQLDDKYLESSEGDCLKKLPIRISRLILVAAVILSLAITVMAVSYFINTISDATAELVGQEGGYGGDFYSVILDTRMSDAAPMEITTYDVPMYLLESAKWTHVDTDYWADELHMAWDNYEDIQYVLYTQTADPFYDGTYPYEVFRVPADTKITKSIVMVDGQKITCIESLPSYDGYTGDNGTKRFYWSDGLYLFKINCMASISTDEVVEIIKSLAPVEDISAYSKPE